MLPWDMGTGPWDIGSSPLGLGKWALGHWALGHGLWAPDVVLFPRDPLLPWPLGSARCPERPSPLKGSLGALPTQGIFRARDAWDLWAGTTGGNHQGTPRGVLR